MALATWRGRKPGAYYDLPRRCLLCGAEYIWSKDSQLWAKRLWIAPPTRCWSCRQLRDLEHAALEREALTRCEPDGTPKPTGPVTHLPSLRASVDDVGFRHDVESTGELASDLHTI
jgi:Probable zinc-ribbon domain